jgi:uncharacterized protein with von Willebrand factor type A (vWA) domain
VKDERNLDKFDRVFGTVFKGLEAFDAGRGARSRRSGCASSPRSFSPRRRRQIEALGGWDKLMETLKKRLEEQKGRHQGGSKWIGTGGTSPFGAYGYNPEGIRIGQDKGRNRRAVKVWDKREFKNLDDRSSSARATSRSRCAGCASSRARARPTSSTSTAPSARPRATPAGSTCKMVPERHNTVKVLLFFDIGGSMDDTSSVCEELFSAARRPSSSTSSISTSTTASTSGVWKDNAAATSERTPTWRRAPQVPPTTR